MSKSNGRKAPKMDDQDLNWIEELERQEAEAAAQTDYYVNHYLIENVMEDLFDAQIDDTQKILGDRWLEKGSFGVAIGPSGVGKSVFAIQAAIEAAVGRPVFGIPTIRPLRVVV